MPDTVSSFMLMCADNAKVAKEVASDCDNIQRDLDSLRTWSKEWQMTFDSNKNLAIANRSRVSCAHSNYTSRASIGLISHELKI